MFEAIPRPLPLLDLDKPIRVSELLSSPCVQTIHHATSPLIQRRDMGVHLYLRSTPQGPIQYGGKLWRSLNSIAPIPDYDPEQILAPPPPSYFRGVILDTWETRQICHRYHAKYHQVGLDAAFIDFIFECLDSAPGVDLTEDQRERLWLTIAAAALQAERPLEAWYVPWLTEPSVKLAALEIFNTSHWGTIISHGHSLYIAHLNEVPIPVLARMAQTNHAEFEAGSF
jgi:hypothetical protein